MLEKFLFILISVVLLAPYKSWGQDNVNGVMIGIISLFILFLVKEIKVNIKYSIALIILNAVALLSFVNTSFTIDSLQGMSLYMALFLFFIIFIRFKDEEQRINRLITYVISGSALFYIIYQGAILKGGILESRIDGNIGYANSYALVMLVGIYFNRIREKDSLKEVFDILLIIAIFFTGSRNTLLYLGIFFIVDLLMNFHKNRQINLVFGFNILISIIMYISIEKIGMALVFVLPIVFIIYYYLINDKNIKIVNILTISSVPIGIIFLLMTNSNLLSRLGAMSFKSNELLLRLGYLEDVIKYVKSHPLGGGINTYVFNQGTFQSGPYDVRYVHNSFGQALYDMGWLGLIAFLIVFIVGAIVIIKGNNKKKIYYLSLYLSIYFHSLLDFDFAYLFTYMIIALIVAFSSTDNYEMNKKINYFKIPVVIFSIYIMFISVTGYIGEYSFENAKYNITVNCGKIINKITVKEDSYGEELQFKGLVGLSREEDGMKIIKQVEDNTHRRTHIYYDLAIISKELGNIKETEYYYEKLIKIQRYNYSLYKAYSSIYNNEDKKAEILKKYEKINNSRSEISKERFK